MTVSLIWAEAHDRVIGADGGIPWRIPGEQALFKQRTMGATVVMGRSTWDSLPPRFRPLPGRRNVVLTRDPAWSAEGAETAGSVDEVLRRYDDVWVIGGAGVYTAFLPHADLVVRTEVDLAVAGDTRAPELGDDWSPRAGEWQTPESGPRYRVVEHTRQTRGQPVPEIVEPQVKLIAWTHFEAPEDVPWSTDADGGQALAEFAGRACYQSWRKPNPATATNAGYLAHILEVNHLSVLEHGTVTFYFTGVSRSFTHELIRHRHLSYSQLSQRYVPERNAAMVEPDVIAQDPELHKKFVAAAEASLRAYTELLEGLEARFTDEPDPTLRRKRARQAARAILPNATETRIVVTGNYRAWRHFIQMRATEHADVEIRQIAVEVLRQLQGVAPNVFADFTISGLDDGSEVAVSPYAPQG